MLAPKINLNGTDIDTLKTEYITALDAVNDAIDAVVGLTVHGRDYDQIQPGTLRIAERDQRDMTTRLLDVAKELTATIHDIQAQE